MKTHNFKILNGDTDSITIYKEDFSGFPEEERNKLLRELNENCPTGLTWEDDGYYSVVIVLKAKNYVLFDGNKLTIKGSALRDSKKETALREFQSNIIDAIVKDTQNYKEIYERYVEEILDVKDIKRWSSKKTITDKVLTNERTNEVQVRNAIAGTDYREADKVWLFFKADDTLCLAEHFDGDYSKVRLLKKLFMSAQVFENVLPIDELFINYSLKKNQKILVENGKTL